ncbi:MAG: family hydrolase [Adhaeribacter sp.]|jgi:histidine triad (HIT) family protein|nr:family hydrolase [Adhaeribacter sp.]
METIFTKIIKGEIPAYKIAEDERFLSFLDVSPLQKGHTLVIPKVQTDYIFDLDDSLLADMWILAKKVAGAVKKATDCKRVGVAVIGLEVPHAHIHLIPINEMNDMNFAQPKKKFSSEDMEAIATKIRAQL